MNTQAIHVETPTPCAEPGNRAAFDLVIRLAPDRSHAKRTQTAIDKYEAVTKYAETLCGDCPERVQCLTVHGTDLDLGVVGGMGAAKRQALFSEKSA